MKDIYIQKVEEISPNIRYCAYNIGDESAIKDLQVMRAKAGREDPLTFRLDVCIILCFCFYVSAARWYYVFM